MSKIIQMLRKHEGFKSKPYHCSAGKLTIGFGRNLEDRGILLSEAELMLNNDLRLITAQANNMVPCFSELNVPRKDVVLDMIYNLGISRFLKFKKMIAAMSEEDYELAADEMLDSKWASQVKSRADYLSKVMRFGEY